MRILNKYQKIQIILLVLIILASILFVMSIVKRRELKNYSTEQAFSDMTDIVSENEIAEESEDENLVDPDTSWDEEAEDTEVNLEEEENAEEKNEAEYYIKINYTANCITVYKKDTSGKYTVPVKAIICSTGKATPTSGVYRLGQKYRWHELNGGVYGQYCSRITGHILFHSVPYAKNSPDSLKYVAYDKLGTKASAGCIRLTTADAIWIYNNCPSGTFVEFYSSSNPGPLGKPSAQKISSVPQCRNWDPTDPTPGNPWHTYKPSPTVNNSQPENNNYVPEQNPNVQVETNPNQEENKPDNNLPVPETPPKEEVTPQEPEDKEENPSPKPDDKEEQNPAPEPEEDEKPDVNESTNESEKQDNQIKV